MEGRTGKDEDRGAENEAKIRNSREGKKVRSKERMRRKGGVGIKRSKKEDTRRRIDNRMN